MLLFSPFICLCSSSVLSIFKVIVSRNQLLGLSWQKKTHRKCLESPLERHLVMCSGPGNAAIGAKPWWFSFRSRNPMSYFGGSLVVPKNIYWRFHALDVKYNFYSRFDILAVFIKHKLLKTFEKSLTKIYLTFNFLKGLLPVLY